MIDNETTVTNPDEYHGWVNRETWAAALHLSNDEWLYNTACTIARAADSRWEAGDNLSDWVENDLIGPVLNPTPGDYTYGPDHQALARNMISDVGSFWRVEWPDVADSFLEE